MDEQPEINITDAEIVDGVIFSFALRVKADTTTLEVITPHDHDTLISINNSLPYIFQEVIEAFSNAHDLIHAQQDLEKM